MMLASFIRRAVSTRPATAVVAPVLSHVATNNANVEFAARAPCVVAAPTAPTEQSSTGNPRTAVLRDEEDLLIASIRRLEAERELARMRRQCEEELGLLRDGLKVREEQVARIVRGKITKAIPKKRSAVAPPHGSAHCVPSALHTSAVPGNSMDALHTGNVPMPHVADVLTTMPTAAKLLAKASDEEEAQHQEQGQEQEEHQGQQGEEGEAFPYTVEPPPPNHTEPGITIPSPAVPATQETNGEEGDAAVAVPKDRVGSSETVAESKAPTSAAKKRSPRSSSKSNNSKSNSRSSAETKRSGGKAAEPSNSSKSNSRSSGGAKRSGGKAAGPSNTSRARKPAKKPESGKSQGARKPAVKKAAPKKNAVAPSKKAPARAKPAAKRVSAVKKAPQGKKKAIAKPKPNARKTNAIRKK